MAEHGGPFRARLRRMCAFCERRRFAVSFGMLTLIHLGLLFLWPGEGRSAPPGMAASQAVRLVEIDLAAAPVQESFAPADLAPVFAQGDEADAALSPGGAASDTGGFLPLSEADTRPVPLIDIRSLMRYPEQARRMHKQGRVVAELDITALGHVYDARLVQRAGWGFDEEVLRAIRGVRFRPAYRGGEAVPVTVQIPVDFLLQ